nr:hypothetical protein [Catellatospora sichuanensis]
MLDASMSYLRQFAPAVLAAVQFAGGPGTEQLLQAVSMLAGLNATGARKVRAGAPVGFVPTKWAGYLVAAEQAGDVTAYRRYWELAVLVSVPRRMAPCSWCSTTSCGYGSPGGRADRAAVASDR